MLPRRLARSLALLVAASWIPLPVPAQCARTTGPAGASIHPSQSVYDDQHQGVPAKSPNGWTIAYCNGNDIFLRFLNASFVAIGNQMLVNTTANIDTQDEPSIAYATNGNCLVAWSDRHGYDGSAMGIMGRVYDSSGAPLGPEFVINQIRNASQWRPLVSPNPAGGFIVAWTGGNDGDAFIRYLNASGGFLTGDILVNTYTFDAQVDTSAAANGYGVTFAAFLDYSSHGNVGTGINLYGRTFDASGNPREAEEFLLTSTTSNGDQRGPRVASDGLGRFFVVWAGEIGDGSGYGIYERVFNRNGIPLLTEFRVNTTTAGDQTNPTLAVDALGRSIVTWEDYSIGATSPRIRARLFNAQANALGDDFVVNDNPSVGAVLPSPAMNSSATEYVIAWEGPGPSPTFGTDLYARRFLSTTGPQTYCSAKMNSLGCTPAIGYSGSPSATAGSFQITATNVLNRKTSLLLYSYDSAFTPYQGSVACLALPFKRGPAQNSGGSATGNDCTGALSIDFNTIIRSGSDPRLVPGTTVNARWLYSDPQDPTGFATGFSNALRFAICP